MLPASYIELMRFQNGGLTGLGYPRPETFRWGNHAEVKTFLGICFTHQDSLGGEFGAKFWMEEWDYSYIGVPIFSSSTCGHEMIYLNYRECVRTAAHKSSSPIKWSDYFTVTFITKNFIKFAINLTPHVSF